MTFGFRKTNAFGFRIDLVESPTGRTPSERTKKNLAKYVVKNMNKMGEKAYKTTQRRGWTPFDTGALRASIHWQDARVTGVANVVPGVLSANVPYAALYELGNSHPRRRFLGRAIDKHQPAFVRALNKRKIVEDITFGRSDAQTF